MAWGGSDRDAVWTPPPPDEGDVSIAEQEKDAARAEGVERPTAHGTATAWMEAQSALELARAKEAEEAFRIEAEAVALAEARAAAVLAVAVDVSDDGEGDVADGADGNDDGGSIVTDDSCPPYVTDMPEEAAGGQATDIGGEECALVTQSEGPPRPPVLPESGAGLTTFLSGFLDAAAGPASYPSGYPAALADIRALRADLDAALGVDPARRGDAQRAAAAAGAAGAAADLSRLRAEAEAALEGPRDRWVGSTKRAPVFERLGVPPPPLKMDERSAWLYRQSVGASRQYGWPGR